MKVKLPKDIVGTKFNKLCLIEWNTYEPDMLLPALFWLISREGVTAAAVRSGGHKDMLDVPRYATALE